MENMNLGMHLHFLMCHQCDCIHGTCITVHFKELHLKSIGGGCSTPITKDFNDDQRRELMGRCTEL
jgi:hypothetical protein